MTFQSSSIIQVYYTRGKEKLCMGRLALKNQKIFFEYDLNFIKTGLELSPFKLPLKAGIIECKDRLFEGLFGIFNDSLPDGWGRLLLDRKLLSLKINPGSLSPLDRLLYVGKMGMGALTYEPEITTSTASHHNSLDEIANEVIQFEKTNDEKFVDDLLALNGSSCGARPKVILTLQEESWIIKFRAALDLKDIGAIEYSYHLLAKEALLDVPEAKLFPSENGPGYFGVKRFDRFTNECLHMHTMSGFLHADHRIPSLDYATILKATLWLTKDARECEKQFRAAVFNVFTHNRDDHAKNFSFLMDSKGIWKVSPSYDLVFSSGPAGEHCTTIMKEGKNPKISHLMQLAEIGGIKKQKALQIIDEVRNATVKWGVLAKNANVTNSSREMIQASLDKVAKNIFSK